MTRIEQYLEANPRFYPIDVFIPEQCALCCVEDTDGIVHIVMDNGRAEIEEFDDE